MAPKAPRRQTTTGGRDATTGVIAGRYSLSVGDPKTPAPSGWRWTSLSEVARLESGHTPSRRVPQYWDGDVPWIGIADATQNHGRIIYQTFQTISQLGIDHSSTRLLPAGTVCLSRTASVGFVIEMGRPMCTSQDFVNWVSYDQLSSKFLRYVLVSEHDSMGRFASGTTHQTIYYPEAKAFHVCLPPLGEQIAIVEILESLDRKIEHLEKQSGTASEIARTIFKSWFVDFAPVRAKAEGREPEGVDTAIAELFPCQLQESPLGTIPDGWDVVSLGELAEFAYGKPLKAENRKDGRIPVMGSNGRIGWHDEALVEGPGIVIGRKGNPGTVTWVHNDFFPIDTTFYVRPKNLARGLYILKNQLDLLSLPTLSADSAVPGLNREMAYQTKLTNPSKAVAERFECITKPLVEKIALNESFIATLAAIRDTLLPRLISGKLRVQEAEKLVEAVL